MVHFLVDAKSYKLNVHQYVMMESAKPPADIPTRRLFDNSSCINLGQISMRSPKSVASDPVDAMVTKSIT